MCVCYVCILDKPLRQLLVVAVGIKTDLVYCLSSVMGTN